MENLNKNSVLVVGTVRNVEKTIFREIKNCQKSLQRFHHISFHLIESDSSDNTLSQLKILKNSIQNFSFTTLGSIETMIPDRIERLRYCRNKYIEHIRGLSNEFSPEFVLVVDLDGMNSALNSKSIDSCFIRDDWDVVTANQTFGYYDILALRHPTWQKNDFKDEAVKKRKEIFTAYDFKYFRKLQKFLVEDKIAREVIYTKMRIIKKDNDWIEVESAYGGAALYKIHVLLRFDYSKIFDSNEADSVTLHRKLLQSGGSIFINPRFINSHFNTYNLNKFFLIRFIRNVVWNNTFIYQSGFYALLKKIAGR